MRQIKFAALLLAALAMVFAAGCGGATGDSPPGTGSSAPASGSASPATATPAPEKKDPVTLTFVIANTVDATPFNKIFEAYTAATGNKVELQALPGGSEFDNLMKTRFSTGDFPDVFLMQPGTKQNIKLRAEDTLEEWSGEADVWERVLPTMKEFQTTADGRIYGVPFGSTGMMGVFYNKDVFDQVGVAPPKNYADLIEIAGKIKAAGITPFYEGVKDGWPSQVFYLTGWVSYVDPEIGEEGVRKLESNELKLADIAAVRDLFAKSKEIKELGLIQDNALAGTFDEMQDRLGEGKAAMTFILDGIVPQMEKKFGKAFVTDKLGFFPFPSATDEGTAMLTPPNQLMVPKEAKHAADAVELVKFMISPEMVDLYYATQPGIPIFAGAKSTLYPVQETVKRFIDAGQSQVNVQNRLSPTFADLPKTLQNFYINGDMDAAINEFSANYEKDGKAKRLPGFE